MEVCDDTNRSTKVCAQHAATATLNGASARGTARGPGDVLGSDCAGAVSGAAVTGARVSWVVGARWFRHAGGMPPSHLASSAPALSGRYLSIAEREHLALLRAQQLGVRACARQLGRAPSTISRELRRNAATRGGGLDYRATVAQWHADRAAQRPKAAKLAMHAGLRQYVQERLAGVIASPGGTPVCGPAVPWKGRRHGRRQHRRWSRAWSPEQIAHRLPLDFPDDPMMRISHEAIYQALYVQGRGALRRELTACLRTGRALRVPRSRTSRTASSLNSFVCFLRVPIPYLQFRETI